MNKTPIFGIPDNAPTEYDDGNGMIITQTVELPMSNAQKVSDLLPCPFCGGEGTYQTDTEEDTFSEEWIGCTDCGATAAIEVWKNRNDGGLYASP